MAHELPRAHSFRDIDPTSQIRGNQDPKHRSQHHRARHAKNIHENDEQWIKQMETSRHERIAGHGPHLVSGSLGKAAQKQLEPGAGTRNSKMLFAGIKLWY